jgi:hypothetical protein
MKIKLIPFLIIIIITACSQKAADNAVQISIAETQAGEQTDIPETTETTQPTETILPTSTSKPTFTPTPEETPILENIDELQAYFDSLYVNLLQIGEDQQAFAQSVLELFEDENLWLDTNWIQKTALASYNLARNYWKIKEIDAPSPVIDLHEDFVEVSNHCGEFANYASNSTSIFTAEQFYEHLENWILCVDNFENALRAISAVMVEYGITVEIADSYDAPELQITSEPDEDVSQPKPPGISQAEVVASTHLDNRFGFHYFLGVVENTGNSPIDDVLIEVFLHNAQGDLLETDIRPVTISPLAPGEKSTFEVSFQEMPTGMTDYDLQVAFSPIDKILDQGGNISTSQGSVTERGGYQIIGEVANTWETDITKITMSAAVYNVDGILLAISRCWTDLDIIPTGSSSPFICDDYNKRYPLDGNAVERYELFITTEPVKP